MVILQPVANYSVTKSTIHLNACILNYYIYEYWMKFPILKLDWTMQVGHNMFYFNAATILVIEAWKEEGREAQGYIIKV